MNRGAYTHRENCRPPIERTGVKRSRGWSRSFRTAAWHVGVLPAVAPGLVQVSCSVDMTSLTDFLKHIQRVATVADSEIQRLRGLIAESPHNHDASVALVPTFQGRIEMLEIGFQLSPTGAVEIDFTSPPTLRQPFEANSGLDVRRIDRQSRSDLDWSDAYSRYAFFMRIAKSLEQTDISSPSLSRLTGRYNPQDEPEGAS